MSPEVIAAIIAASVSFLTLIGTLAAQYFGRRATSKQLDRTFAEQRIQTLNERFATAAEQLGSDKPAVQLAGVYAMAGLADDWKENLPKNRQTCVDVLCAFLRIPHELDPGADVDEPKRLARRARSEVRDTVFRVITAHLRADAAVSWRGLNFDFTGVAFDGKADFSRAEFTGGNVSFAAAKFTGGKADFEGAKFTGGKVSFAAAEFTGGEVDFGFAEFTGGMIDFEDAKFADGEVNFGFAKFTGARVSFEDAKFTGGKVSFVSTEFRDGRVEFASAEFTGGQVFFPLSEFTGGMVSFGFAKFTAGHVNFVGAKFRSGRVSFICAKFTGGEINFIGAKFTGGEVDFDGAEFTGATVSFSTAEFIGAQVDFTDAGDWSSPPEFPWADLPPPGVKLPRKEDQSQP
jgi:uncharacterized protein YjbI with pentapeptide repeats